MKAIGLTRYLPIDDPESLVDIELPRPEPEAHDLLVSVKAVSVNPVDTKVRAPKEGVEDPPKAQYYLCWAYQVDQTHTRNPDIKQKVRSSSLYIE